MSKDISKFMSYVLRHHPEAAGLAMDEHGWVDAHDLILAIRERGHPDFTAENLEAIVVASDKQRFQLIDGRIRANQGHSVTVDLSLKSVTPPDVLYHGTKLAYMDSIRANGLQKGTRHHVHLSADKATAQIVARRRKGESVILRINASAMSGTHKFFLSENGVWLVDHVPEVFIDILP